MAALEPWSDLVARGYWNPSAAELSASTKLQSRFELLTKENEEDLQGKTVLELREEFGHWVTTVPKEAKRCISRPRYDYFLYVDKRVLDKFKRVEAERGDAEPNYIAEEVVAIAVEAQSIHWDENRRSDEEDEENHNDDEGKEWQYVQAYSIPNLYDSVLDDGEAWYTFFTMPPRVHGMAG
ncbi:hypothetical protein F5Y13DRAFT_187385 [Hypoxylon sp. FL1857]|nr:hypothetical protein F5Y13DRAFT_187385 [Hypoxylon sp. FL1857]